MNKEYIIEMEFLFKCGALAGLSTISAILILSFFIDPPQKCTALVKVDGEYIGNEKGRAVFLMDCDSLKK